MKNILVLCTVLLAGTNLLRAADDEADHAALRIIKDTYEQAIDSGDLTKLAPYVAENATGVMVTGEEVKGFSGLQDYWARIQKLIGAGGKYQVTVQPNRSDLFGDTAIGHGTTEDVVTTGSGKTYKFNSYWTALCRKQNGQWKVLRLQATMDPVSNPFVTAQIHASRLIFGAGGLLSGILIMLGFTLLRRAAPKT